MNNLVQIMDENTIMRSLLRMTHEIIEHDENINNVVLIGIKNKGMAIANILKANLKKFTGIDIPLGSLDTTTFRDDIPLEKRNLLKNTSDISFDINGKIIILIDDVLYTGRTVRAAIEGLFSLGRPNKVQLAVLIDRGHRELPIRPDYVGKNVPSSKNERVNVKMNSLDGIMGVFISKV